MSLIGHAYIGAGSADDIEAVFDFLRERGEAVSGPDLWMRVFSHMGVEEAREIRERASLKPVQAPRRTFVMLASQITVEAQNALLKVFEEPPAQALFVLMVPAPHTLLPTLRSRAQMFTVQQAQTSAVDIEAFMRALPQKRLDMLKPLLEKKDDDKRDIGLSLAFIADLERYLASRLTQPGFAESIRTLYTARVYLGDKGALVKPLLEQLAFSIPLKR